MREYTNMGFQDMSKEILEVYEDSHLKLMELNSLYRKAIEQDIKILDAQKVSKQRKSRLQRKLNLRKFEIQKFHFLEKQILRKKKMEAL